MKSNPFGRLIRRHRQDAGLSLRAAGSLIGISHVYLGNVERGASGLAESRWPSLLEALPSLTPGMLALADHARREQLCDERTARIRAKLGLSR